MKYLFVISILFLGIPSAFAETGSCHLLPGCRGVAVNDLTKGQCTVSGRWWRAYDTGFCYGPGRTFSNNREHSAQFSHSSTQKILAKLPFAE